MGEYKFRNTENVAHTSKETGQTIWASRSVTVAIRFRIKDEHGNYLHLLTQRGEKVTDSGTWCFPCGYIDRDETIVQAAQRELYEETGIIISEDNFYRYHIEDRPHRDKLQNVTFHFDVFIDDSKGDGKALRKYDRIVRTHVESHLEEGEVVDHIFTTDGKGLKIVFHHDDRFQHRDHFH